MTTFLNWFFGPGHFMSHGHCYLWNPALVNLHVWSDSLIGISYVAISLTLWTLVRKARADIPFHWMFIAFGLFIIACGTTHFMEVWTIWNPVYWLSGSIKVLTAAASVVTAIALPPLVPKTREMLEAARISEARRVELEAAYTRIQSMNEELETRVAARTRELAEANEALAEKAAIVQHSSDAIFSRGLDGVITSWNAAAERLYGYTAAEISGQTIDLLFPPGDSASEQARSAEETDAFETTVRSKSGDRADISVSVSPIIDVNGNRTGAAVIARDITERKRADRQILQTQKLESLGLIAGGVAHDFNNLLVGILGNASLVLDSLPQSSVNRPMLEVVVDASEKASHLTRQLLAYAGKGRFVIELVNLTSLVREISTLIQTSISKAAHLRLELAQSLPPVEVDPGQLQQVIMNLVINAAEAIPEGQTGTVLVTTEVHDVDEQYLAQNFAGEKLSPGRYVSLEVHDTGTGMSEEVRARIFDPFFTTKFTGRGLGLAAVMGIVRGHKGTIRVYSVPGKGTTFKVLLPASGNTAIPNDNRDRHHAVGGTGTILVVDDEEVVRKTCKSSLERYGYTVLTADDGKEGVELFRGRSREISAVILDMTMPVMSGEEAFRHLRAIRPDIRIVVSSGYNEVEAIRRFTARGIAAFIQKPYTAAKLAQVLKDVLTENGAGPA